MQRQSTELRLPATREMPRKLNIEFVLGQLCVHMYPPGKRFVSLAGGSSRIKEASLHHRSVRGGDPCLFVGSEILFRLTDAEAAEVERVFGPHGLPITREAMTF